MILYNIIYIYIYEVFCNAYLNNFDADTVLACFFEEPTQNHYQYLNKYYLHCFWSLHESINITTTLHTPNFN